MTYFNRQKINYVVIGFIVLFGSLIAIERGSNFSDSDAPSVILTFLDFIDTGHIVHQEMHMVIRFQNF